jgi:hypothetical protein
MRCAAMLVLAACLLVCFPAAGLCLEQGGYVGSQACKDCHQEQYDNYLKYAKKAKSFEHIQAMSSKLEPDEIKTCYACHTTGYGRPGGFVSQEATPQLCNVGCESCHGPGAAHAKSGDPKLIARKMSVEQCRTCHNEDRVKSFGFKPITTAGAH